jgi:aminoglycoside phosphotransferase (APT) family kinase protein
VVNGRALLLRIIMRTDDPGRHFQCMRAAAEAGLAPAVLYTSIEDRISITSFVNTVPFARTVALRHLPATLRSLHELPRFPRVPDAINTSCLFLLTSEAAVAGLFAKVRAAGVLTGDEADELFELYKRLASAYPVRDMDLVSSHNDLFKPDNILFDGSRVWLVDWEAAFLNDRYADLAVVANMIVRDEAEEFDFLREYFGQAPDAVQQARLFLMRQLAHLFYMLAFVFSASLAGPVRRSENTPGWALFQQQFWEGAMKLEDSASKVAYGMGHLKRLRQNARTPRFKEALSIVASER